MYVSILYIYLRKKEKQDARDDQEGEKGDWGKIFLIIKLELLSTLRAMESSEDEDQWKESPDPTRYDTEARCRCTVTGNTVHSTLLSYYTSSMFEAEDWLTGTTLVNSGRL